MLASVLHATCHIQSRTQPNATHNTQHTELLGQVAKALSNDILHNNRSICGLNGRKEICMATHTCSKLFPHMFAVPKRSGNDCDLRRWLSSLSHRVWCSGRWLGRKETVRQLCTHHERPDHRQGRMSVQHQPIFDGCKAAH